MIGKGNMSVREVSSWFYFLNSCWIYDRNRTKSHFLIMQDWETWMFVRIEWFAQDRRRTVETIDWTQSFQYLMERTRISGWFRCVCCLELEILLISTITVTWWLQRMQQKRKEICKENQGRKIIRRYSISIIVWIRMCFKRSLI